MALCHDLMPVCAVHLVHKAPHILFASPVQVSETEKENGREEHEYFQCSPHLTWRGSCVMPSAGEKRDEGPAYLEICPPSAGLPPAAHPPFSRPNLMLEHPLFARAVFCRDFV